VGEFVPFLLKVGTYVLEVGKFVIFTHFLFQIWEQSGYKGEAWPCRGGGGGGERENSMLFHVLHIFQVMLFCHSSPTYHVKIDKKLCGNFKMQLIHQFSESIINIITITSLSLTHRHPSSRAPHALLCPPRIPRTRTHSDISSKAVAQFSPSLSTSVHDPRVRLVGMDYMTYSCYMKGKPGLYTRGINC